MPYCERLTIYTHTHDRPTIHNAAKRFGIFFYSGPRAGFCPVDFFPVKFSEIQNSRACVLSGSHAHIVVIDQCSFFYAAINRIFFARGFHVCVNTGVSCMLLYCITVHVHIIIIMAVLNINITLLYYYPRTKDNYIFIYHKRFCYFFRVIFNFECIGL